MDDLSQVSPHILARHGRWSLTAVVPLVVGMVWLLAGWRHGPVIGVLASVPGLVSCGAGTAFLLWPGNRHVTHNLALFSALGGVLAIVMAWPLGLYTALFLLAGSIVNALLAGAMALRYNPVPEAVPAAEAGLVMMMKVALDEGFLAFFVACSSIPRGTDINREADDIAHIESLIRQHDWKAHPAALHATPVAPQAVDYHAARWHGKTFGWLSFASQYQPSEQLPNAAFWVGQQTNRQVYARIFDHGDTDEGIRPWLVCLHGYRMGTPASDFSLFDADHLHHKLGLNLLMPILPLHGARRQTLLSGGGYLDGRITSPLHAQLQALSDIRQCMVWLRQAHAARKIGVLGYSLGGYNAALLAALEPDLACVIAGIPLTDITDTLWRNMPVDDRRHAEAAGVTRDRVSNIMVPVSPLHLPPLVAYENRYIFAAAGDQIVPPAQPYALWQHWGEPAMHWYQGSHLSVRREHSVSRFVDQALRESLLA